MPEEVDFPDWLAEAAIGLASGDVESWMAMYAEDAVHEFPFAAAGGIRELAGKNAIRAYMTAMGADVQFGSLDDVSVREAGDELIIEAEGHHFTEAGKPFDIRYLWMIRHDAGVVTRLRDFMGPRRMVEEA